ncbi:hypothetical protein ACLOJK_000859 [Asimina triloba]
MKGSSCLDGNAGRIDRRNRWELEPGVMLQPNVIEPPSLSLSLALLEAGHVENKRIDIASLRPTQRPARHANGRQRHVAGDGAEEGSPDQSSCPLLPVFGRCLFLLSFSAAADAVTGGAHLAIVRLSGSVRRGRGPTIGGSANRRWSGRKEGEPL